jgi:hypothetical protein
MSSTPWSAKICSTIVNTRSRMSGNFIGGSGREMSSITMVTFIPGSSIE